MRLSRLFSVAACTALVTLPVYAQTAPAAAPQRDDEVVELSPFIINAKSDDGYYSANAISGTRVATQIKNLPLNLSVISEEFLRDAAIYDVDSILQWTASNTGPNNPRIRGLNSNTPLNRLARQERCSPLSLGPG